MRKNSAHLSTTDPAAPVATTVGEVASLEVSPQAETKRYVARVMATARKGPDANGLALLEEDVRSPCTEEIAVFRAFARRARHAAVVPWVPEEPAGPEKLRQLFHGSSLEPPDLLVSIQ